MLRENEPQSKQNFPLKIDIENTEVFLYLLIPALCFCSHPPLFHRLVLALMEIVLSIIETQEQIVSSAGLLRRRLEADEIYKNAPKS